MSAMTTSSTIAALKLIAADIKIAHSVFALPFAVLAAVMAAMPGQASIDWNRFTGQIALIIAAMILARTVAMLANRLLDREVDKDNPRTASRAIPSGKLSVRVALSVLIICAIAFMLVCLGFGAFYENWWPTFLGLPVLAWLSAYPLLKRFTSLSHLYLGSSLAISPLAAAIAINPDSVTSQPALWLLAAMVMCWVAGFDIIYALADVEVDRKHGLSSLPAKLGTAKAMWISRLFHVFSLACLIAILMIDNRLQLAFGVGIGIVTILLILEHLTVARWGTGKITLAFFTLNGVISCILGTLGLFDLLMN